MAGVADQEHGALPVDVGEEPARHPLVGGKDLVGEVDPRRPGDGRSGVGVGEGLALLHAGRHEEPDLALVHGADQARAVGVDLPVLDGRPVGVRLRQSRGAEDDVVVAGEAVAPFHSGADEIAHTAPGPVGADKVARRAVERRAAGVLQAGDDALALSLGLKEAHAEANVHRGERAGVVQQHALEGVLGNPLRVLGIEVGARRRGVEGVAEVRQAVASEPGHEPDVVGIVDPERRGGRQRVGQAPPA